ncbi:MAG: hypothetical protein HQL73_09325, partial [Magnetococcales bacterium]|nr:hypothetical protein [Magnetococcales bacterium]
ELFQTMFAGSEGLQWRNAFDGTGNVVFRGLAAPDATEDAPAWRIMKIGYDGSGNPVSGSFAQGDATFSKVWAQRATYIY